MDALRYWGRVVARAFSQTLRFLGFEDRKRAVVSFVGFGTAIVVVRSLGGSEQMSDELRWGIATLVAAGVVFIPTLAANLILAPSAIDREQRDRLRELSPKLLLRLELDLSEFHWAHILVTNRGQTDHFEAQLLNVQDESAVLPFLLKWRQSDEEAQQIIRGQTKVLDFAHSSHTSGWRRDEGLGEWCCLVIRSTTAETAFGGRYVKYLDEETRELQAEATDEELARPVRLLVEVRGVDFGAVAKGRVLLGFKRKDEALTPDGTIELCD